MSLILRRSGFVSRHKCLELAVCSGTNIPSAGYIFSMVFHHLPFWFVAASWDCERNITYAYLHCTSESSEESIPRIKRFITQMASYALHPLLLPVLIMDLETNLTLREDGRWTREINEIEKETRQRPYDSEAVDPLNLNLSSIMQRLNGCSVFLSLIEQESEVMLLHLNQVHEILDVQLTSLILGNPSRTLTKHVEFLINSRKNLLLRLQNLQRRSQTQLAFVCPSHKNFLLMILIMRGADIQFTEAR